MTVATSRLILQRSGKKFLPESLEFFTRASVTDGNAKWRINQFVKGLKQLGLWDYIIYVTCHSDMGALHQLGGSSYKTNTAWSLQDDAALTTNGVTASNNPTAFAYTHGVTPSVTFTTASLVATPVFHGGFFSQDYSDTHPNGLTHAISGPFVRNYVALGTWNGTGPYGNYVAGVQTYDPYITTYSSTEHYRSRNRPYMVCTWMHGSGSTCLNLVNDNYASGTAAGAHTAGTNLIYVTGVPNDGSKGTIHGLFMVHGDPASIGGKVVWQRFRALVESTLLSHKRAGGYLKIQTGGQSNADEWFIYLNRDNINTNAKRCSEIRSGTTAGAYITNWIGTGTPARNAAYEASFWKGDGTGPMEVGRPLLGVGRWQEWVCWFQGESDTQDQTSVDNYLARLQALVGFWRADAQNPNLQVLICKIDYTKGYRSATIGSGCSCNFTVSGVTGGGTVLNVAWVMDALAADGDDYLWRYSTTYILKRQNSRWEFVRTSDSVVMAYSNTNPAHPCLVAAWTVVVGAGTPSFTATRTGWIEGIRKVQQDFVDADAHAHILDSRGYARQADGSEVHLTTAARQAFATAAAAIIEAT